jgi:hypothetical protein
VIYLGKDEPIDLIRWVVFGESLQDYAILQTVGISPDDALRGDTKTYAEFLKNRGTGAAEGSSKFSAPLQRLTHHIHALFLDGAPLLGTSSAASVRSLSGFLKKPALPQLRRT